HSEESPWRSPATQNSEGSQIDLLIDRADRTINICEMKFYNGEFTIDKAYASELERKLNVFGEQTKTKKSLFLTFITTYGIKKNEHAGRMVHKELTMDIFFK
ncbi:MAG: ATP-binding protein, partial [Flavitalea sp.]